MCSFTIRIEMIKCIFKWLFRLFLLAVVPIVILLPVAQFDSPRWSGTSHPRPDRHGRGDRKFLARPRRADGDDQNFKLYNPPDFGGTPFLDIPEIHAEYDRAALAQT